MVELDILISPAVLRFSVYQGHPFFVLGGQVEVLMDGMENLFKANLGFFPFCNTVLIRGDKNIIVDPGVFQLGAYGILTSRLEEFDLKPEDIDIVVNTHPHYDHYESNYLFRGKKLIIHEKDLKFAYENYWPEYVSAFFNILKIQNAHEGDMLAEEVTLIETPGHTPGSISLLVNTPKGLVAIIGDVAMTKSEYITRKLSRWYTQEQKEMINRSLDKIVQFKPDLVIPGHDAPFAPKLVGSSG